MKEHVNFYENLQEAKMRLRGTVVLYDKLPYQVIAITDHKSDGILRIYLDPIGWDSAKSHDPVPGLYNIPHDHPELGNYIDKFLDANPNSPVLRKQMNSPLFNKYRPFPLGMCNVGTETYYVERQPQRRTEQGLTRSMLYSTPVTTGSRVGAPRMSNGIVDVWTKEFRACILGEHPSAQECITALNDPNIENESVAFHREFALTRGPLDMLYLAYKSDIVGVLPDNNLSLLRIGRNYQHTREVIESLGLFKQIQ